MSSSKIFVPNFCRNDELSSTMSWVGCLLTDSGLPDTYMKVKRMGITEMLKRIWLFSTNKIKSSEYISKQSSQVKLELNSSLWKITVAQNMKKYFFQTYLFVFIRLVANRLEHCRIFFKLKTSLLYFSLKAYHFRIYDVWKLAIRSWNIALTHVTSVKAKNRHSTESKRKIIVFIILYCASCHNPQLSHTYLLAIPCNL